MSEISDRVKQFIEQYEKLIKSYVKISKRAKDTLNERNELLTELPEDLATEDAKIRAEIKSIYDRLNDIHNNQYGELEKFFAELSEEEKQDLSDIWENELKANLSAFEKQVRKDVKECLISGKQCAEKITEEINKSRKSRNLPFPKESSEETEKDKKPEKPENKSDTGNSAKPQQNVKPLFEPHYFGNTIFGNCNEEETVEEDKQQAETKMPGNTAEKSKNEVSAGKFLFVIEKINSLLDRLLEELYRQAKDDRLLEESHPQTFHVSVRAGRGVSGTTQTEVYAEGDVNIEDTTEEPADVIIKNANDITAPIIAEIRKGNASREDDIARGMYRATKRDKEGDETPIEAIHRLRAEGWSWERAVAAVDFPEKKFDSIPKSELNKAVDRRKKEHKRAYP